MQAGFQNAKSLAGQTRATDQLTTGVARDIYGADASLNESATSITGPQDTAYAEAMLNLSATELQALPLDQRFVAIQEALNRFVPEAERAVAASDLFGDKAALAFLRIDPATLREAAQDDHWVGCLVGGRQAKPIDMCAWPVRFVTVGACLRNCARSVRGAIAPSRGKLGSAHSPERCCAGQYVPPASHRRIPGNWGALCRSCTWLAVRPLSR